MATPSHRGSTRDPFQHLKIRDFTGHAQKVHSVAWNCVGTKLGSGSVDQTVRVWTVDPTTSASSKARHDVLELRGHTDSVDNLCWDPTNASVLASASQDKSVRFWDVRSGKCESMVALKGENINVAYNPDATHIAVGNSADELTILDVRKMRKIFSRKFSCELNEFHWEASGRLFFLTTGLGTVEVLSYPSMQTLDVVQAHAAGVYSLAFDPCGRYFAVGSADAIVSLWDLSEMLCVRTFPQLAWPVRSLSFSHDGAYLAYGSEDSYIDIAAVETGRSVHQVGPTPPMNSIEWNPRHYLLAFAGDEKYSGVVKVFGFEGS